VPKIIKVDQCFMKLLKKIKVAHLLLRHGVLLHRDSKKTVKIVFVISLSKFNQDN